MKLSVFLLIALLERTASENGAETDFRDDLCLNGSYDELSKKCICRPGYTDFRGSCFLSIDPVANAESNVRSRSRSSCSPGLPNCGGSPSVCEGTLCDSSCPPGYELRSGFCVIPNPNCPAGTLFQNGMCYSHVRPLERIEIVEPLRVNIPVPQLPDNVDNQDSSDPEIEIVPTRRPLRLKFPRPVDNVVHNMNTVTSPTNVSTHNVNNVYVHITQTRRNGVVKAVVIRNNETTVYESPTTPKGQEPTDSEDEANKIDLIDSHPVPTNRCCIIVSPRICRKQQQEQGVDEWVCFHRKHYRCGDFCTSDIIYLRPRQPQYRNSELVMPPNYLSALRYGTCRWGSCPSVDCSGCLQGRYRCHYKCYTYDCVQQGGKCNYLNLDEFCGDNDDEICGTIPKTE